MGFYFRVPDIESAQNRISKGGGTVAQGPMEVPGGEMVLNAVCFRPRCAGQIGREAAVKRKYNQTQWLMISAGNRRR
jgi:hypothetical protein